MEDILVDLLMAESTAASMEAKMKVKVRTSWNVGRAVAHIPRASVQVKAQESMVKYELWNSR